MEKKDLRHLKRKELIDLIDKMQTDSDLVSNVEVKKELGRLKEREKYLKHLRKTLSVLVVVAACIKDLWFEYGSNFRKWAGCGVYKDKEIKVWRCCSILARE